MKHLRAGVLPSMSGSLALCAALTVGYRRSSMLLENRLEWFGPSLESLDLGNLGHAR
jgi:hypothetical protein